MCDQTEIRISPLLDYHATSFSTGRMDFTWEEFSEEAVRQAYADWEAGKGLIGGDPRRRPHADSLPAWGLDQPFFRALALDDARGNNGPRLRAALSSSSPLELEIGFGRGDFLLDRAVRHGETLFLGFETNTKAARLCLKRVQRLGLDNLWLSDDDCRFTMPRLIPDGRVQMVHILFPDPWWKEQHRLKRLFSPPFADLLSTKIQSHGLLVLKTDVPDYGELVAYLLQRQGSFFPPDPALADDLGPHAHTHREHWCLTHQRPVYAYYFRRR